MRNQPSIRLKRPTRVLLVGEAVQQLGEAWRLVADVRPSWFFAMAGSRAIAHRHLEEHDFDAVIVGVCPLGDGGELLNWVRLRWPQMQRIAVLDSAAPIHAEVRQASLVLSPPFRSMTLLTELDRLFTPPAGTSVPPGAVPARHSAGSRRGQHQ